MPKTFGEWLFLASIILFSFVGAINQIVATSCLVSSLILGYREGFDTALILMSSIFGLLLVSDLVSIFAAKPEKILKSVWPNLFVATIRFAYLIFAGLLFAGLFWSDGLEKYYWIYLVVAVWLTVVNLPWMVFHLTLCIPKCRQYISELDAKTRCTCSEECNCQNPPQKIGAAKMVSIK